MEGTVARWYARNMGKGIEEYRTLAQALAAELPERASVLEVASGPGYLAIELAKLGNYHVMGVDISKTFVEIATANAEKEGVAVAFHLGNASDLPFDCGSFDLVVCRAAFKNFTEPVKALEEMHRVLKPGGKALIYDLRPDAAPADIAAAVGGMKLGWLNSLFTRLTFKHMLLKRAHSKDSLRKMVAQTPFQTCEIKEDLIGLEVALKK
jgi:ubiquinone/menaquinone biosynthesis C-methylase UbiE